MTFRIVYSHCGVSSYRKMYYYTILVSIFFLFFFKIFLTILINHIPTWWVFFTHLKFWWLQKHIGHIPCNWPQTLHRWYDGWPLTISIRLHIHFFHFNSKKKATGFLFLLFLEFCVKYVGEYPVPALKRKIPDTIFFPFFYGNYHINLCVDFWTIQFKKKKHIFLFSSNKKLEILQHF